MASSQNQEQPNPELFAGEEDYEHLLEDYSHFAPPAEGEILQGTVLKVTDKEVIVDFALNPNPFMAGKQEVSINQRLIMNFYTAKRLCSALAMTLQRHEATFGNIELDVRRRTVPPQTTT